MATVTTTQEVFEKVSAAQSAYEASRQVSPKRERNG